MIDRQSLLQRIIAQRLQIAIHLEDLPLNSEDFTVYKIVYTAVDENPETLFM